MTVKVGFNYNNNLDDNKEYNRINGDYDLIYVEVNYNNHKTLSGYFEDNGDENKVLSLTVDEAEELANALMDLVVKLKYEDQINSRLYRVNVLSLFSDIQKEMRGIRNETTM